MLPEAQARSLLVGIGPAIPPPTLTGLPVPRQAVTQQTWQAAPQAGFSLPAGLAAGCKPENLCVVHTAHCTAAHERCTWVTGTGLLHTAPLPGAVCCACLCLPAKQRCVHFRSLQVHGAAAGEGATQSQNAAFPPMAAADARRYEHIFQQMDADKDNYVLVSSDAGCCLAIAHVLTVA